MNLTGYRLPACLRAGFAATLLLAASTAYGAVGTAQGDALLTVPHPQMSTLKPEVRATLEPALAYFNKRVSAGLEPQELGLAYGQLGMHYQAQEQQAAARIAYLNAMRLDQQNFRWPYLLAVHYEETGDIVAATEYYLQSLNLAPGNIPAQTRLARLIVKAGRLDEAETLFTEVLQHDSSSAASLAGLGDIAAARDQHWEAVQFYKRALGVQPEASQLHYRIGLSYRELGKVDEARTHLEQRGPRIPSIDDPLLSFVQGHTLGAGYFVRAGEQAMAQGNMQNAANLFSAAAAIYPENALALVGVGQAQAATGRLDAAAESFEQALAIDNGNTVAHYFRGAIYEIEGNDARALQHYQAAVSADPEHFEAGLMLSNTLMRLQRYDEAAQQYGRMAGMRNNSNEFLYQEALAWLAGKRCAPAEAALLKAFQGNPANNRVVQALARLYSVCASANEERRQQALQQAQRLYDEFPGLETAATLAMAMAANGNFEAAVDYQTQAVFEALKLDPTAADPWLNGNLQRYRQQQPAVEAWPVTHSVYQPERLSLDRL